MLTKIKLVLGFLSILVFLALACYCTFQMFVTGPHTGILWLGCTLTFIFTASRAASKYEEAFLKARAKAESALSQSAMESLGSFTMSRNPTKREAMDKLRVWLQLRGMPYTDAQISDIADDLLDEIAREEAKQGDSGAQT